MYKCSSYILQRVRGGRSSLHAHFGECGDAFSYRRMRREKPSNKATGLVRTERIRDEEVRRRMARALHRPFVGRNFYQGRSQSIGIAREKCARGVGKEFAPARDRKLDELRGDGSKDDAYEPDDHYDGVPAPAAVMVPPSPEAYAQEEV